MLCWRDVFTRNHKLSACGAERGSLGPAGFLCIMQAGKRPGAEAVYRVRTCA